MSSMKFWLIPWKYISYQHSFTFMHLMDYKWKFCRIKLIRSTNWILLQIIDKDFFSISHKFIQFHFNNNFFKIVSTLLNSQSHKNQIT